MTRLLSSSLVARLPLGMSAVAMLLFARDAGLSFGVAGAALAAMGFANAAVAPLQGAIIDRRGQVGVLAATVYGQGALLVLFAVTAPRDPIAFIVLAALIGFLVPPATAAFRALLPTISGGPEQLERIYALDAIGTESIFTLGPMVVAGLIAVGSPPVAIGAMAAFSVIGGTVYLTSATVRGWKPPHRRRAGPRRGALSVTGLRPILATIVLVSIAIGAIQVTLAALALDLGSSSLATLMLTLWSIGSIVGGLTYFRVGWSLPASRRYGLLVAAIACGSALVLVADALWPALTISLIAGVAIAPSVACQNGLIGDLVPDGMLAEAFTWNTSGAYGGIAAGSGLGGALIDSLGFRGGALLGTVAAGLGALVAWRWRESLSRPRARGPSGLPSRPPAADEIGGTSTPAPAPDPRRSAP